MAWQQTFADFMTGTPFASLPSREAAWEQNTTFGTWRISTGGFTAGCTVSATARCYLISSQPGPDQSCRFTLVAGLSPNLQVEEGLLVRFLEDDTNDFWGGIGYVTYVESGNQLIIQRLDGGGSHTPIAVETYTPANGDVLRVEVVGSTIKALVNGLEIIEVNDATHTTGTVGVWSGTSLDDQNAMSVDNFVAEEWVVAAVTGIRVRESRLRPRIFAPGLAR